jgi:hypothetical protein
VAVATTDGLNGIPLRASGTFSSPAGPLSFPTAEGDACFELYARQQFIQTLQLQPTLKFTAGDKRGRVHILTVDDGWRTSYNCLPNTEYSMRVERIDKRCHLILRDLTHGTQETIRAAKHSAENPKFQIILPADQGFSNMTTSSV